MEKDIQYDKLILEGIKQSLENAFIYIEDFDIKNIELSDFLSTSLQFMTFVVELEEYFLIEFPPELLILDNFSNLENLYHIIKNLIENNK